MSLNDILEGSYNVQRGQLQNIVVNRLTANNIVNGSLLTGLVKNDESKASNNTLIINNAINLLPDGGTLQFERGLYYINDTINVKYNSISIHGETPENTILKMASGSNTDMIYVSLTTTDVIKGITIKNIQFDGNKANNSNGHMLKINNGYIVTVDNCYFIDSAERSIWITGTSSPKSSLTTLKNLNIERAGGNSIYLDVNAQDSNLYNVFTQDAETTGIIINGFGNRLYACHAYRNSGDGLLINDFSGRNIIDGCNMDFNDNWGIKISGSRENIITDCLIFANDQASLGQGGIVITNNVTTSNRNIISDNLLYDDQGTPTMTTGIKVDNTNTGNVIINNMVTSQISTRLNISSSNLCKDNFEDGTFYNFLNSNLRAVSITFDSNQPKTNNFMESGDGNLSFSSNDSQILFGCYNDGSNYRASADSLYGLAINYLSGDLIISSTVNNITTEDNKIEMNERMSLAKDGTIKMTRAEDVSGKVVSLTSNLQLLPSYNASSPGTISEVNYIEVQQPATSGSVTINNASILRFNSGTNPALAGSRTAGTACDNSIKVNINGTIGYIPWYTF